MKQVAVKTKLKSDYAFQEAINTICTNITFSGVDVSCIEITSCREHDGKSLMTTEIWRNLGKMGLKTVLIDADFRRSAMNHSLGVKIQANTGLAHYLSKSSLTPDDILYETDLENCYYIATGRDVSNSMQLLSGERLPELIEYLKENFDYVLIDTPPVGAIVDAAVIAQWCDGALLVVSQNVVTKNEVLQAKSQLEKSGCPIIGAILNKVDMEKKSSRYYTSGSYYSAYRSGYYYKSKGKSRKN